MKIKTFIIFALLIMLFGCDYFTLLSNKEWCQKTDNKEVDVYVAGNTTTPKAFYYINDVKKDLETIGGANTEINAMDIYNNDIYCAGCYNPSGNFPCYWKNGKIIPVEFSSANAEIIDIKVINGNVYSAGFDDNDKACYWINDKIYYLNSPWTGWAKSIYVDKETYDFYIAGFYINGTNFPCYWKNGEEFIPLESDPAGNVQANAIYSVSGNIYIAGQYKSTAPARTGYWINNKFIPLDYGGAASIYTNDIKVYNGDIYTAGWFNGPPAHLKNFKTRGRNDLPGGRRRQ